MYWAEQIGAREVYNQIALWHQSYGNRWQPSNLLRGLTDEGGKFHHVKTR